MTAARLETSRTRSEAAVSRILLSCNSGGSWTLSGSGRRARQFTDFDAALDSARHAPNSETATIEVWQGGEYICCLQAEERPHRGALAHTAPIASERRGVTAERYANRAAQVLMAAAGPLFWVALLIITLAASLGWRLALL